MRKLLFLSLVIPVFAFSMDRLPRDTSISITFGATPNPAQIGQTVLVTWSATNADECEFFRDGDFVGAADTSGSASFPMPGPVDALLACSNHYGNNAEAELHIEVVNAEPHPEPTPDPVPPPPDPAPEPTPDPTPTPNPSSYPGVPSPPFSFNPPSTRTVGVCGTHNGTETDWITVRVNSIGSACNIQGSYVIVENTGAREMAVGGENIIVRDSEVANADKGAAVVLSGRNIVLLGNDIHHNGGGNYAPTKDKHGVTLAAGTQDVWILGNNIHDNAGDAIQFCHGCIGHGNGPMNVYISGNDLHGDEENALDFKEFRGRIVITNNDLHGYQPGQDSNGEAVRINDEGDQGEIWAAGNRCFDNYRDIQPQNSRAQSYLLDNSCRVHSTTTRGSGFVRVAEGAAAQQHYDLYEQKYGVSLRP